MPGYSQLKKLSEQILKLGNEIKVRSARGEQALPFPVSESIPDIDDSEDFLTGMPEKPLPPEEEIEEVEEEPVEEGGGDASGIDDLLSGLSDAGDVPDLSAFDTEPKPKKTNKKPEPKKEESPPPPPKPKGINGTGYSGFGFDEDGNLEDTSAESGKPDIAALMGGPGKKPAAFEGTGIPELDAILNPPKPEKAATPDIPDIPLPEATIPDIPIPEAAIPDIPVPDIPSPETPVDETPATETSDAIPSFDDLPPLDDLPSLDELPEIEEIVSEDGAGSDDVDVFEQNMTASVASLDDAFQDIFTTTTNEPEPVAPPEPSAPAIDEISTTEFIAPSEDAFAEDFGVPITEETTPPAASAKVEEPKADTAGGSESSDFDDWGFTVEEYTPSETPKPSTGSNFVFDEESQSEGEDVFVPEQEEKKEERKVAKLLSIEEDLAILKPDIFTENPVTRENPPYYAVDPYGTIPSAIVAQNAPPSASVEPPPKESAAPQPEEQADDSDFEVEDVTGLDSDSSGFDNEFSLDNVIDMGEDLPEGISETPPAPQESAPAESQDFEVEEYNFPDMPGENSDFDMPFDQPEAETAAAEEETVSEAAPPEQDPFASVENFEPSSNVSDDVFNMDMDSFSMDSFGGESAQSENVGDLSGEMPDFGDLGDTTDFSGGSSLEDFNIPDTDSQLDKAKNDFALDGEDFSIPGFSEDDADPYATAGKGGLDAVDFTGAVKGDGKTRTSLTEEEYKKFKKNLSEYPLNVRIAVEDMIVQNEFTDEVVFELIDKILKKVTARQLAGYLEKMLDIPLHVPRDFEKRTAEEYEAYKASFSYQLKARILPIALMGLLAVIMCVCIGYLGHRFIYKPLKAESLYKEGYTLLESNNYPQSEMKFDEALTYKSKKKWFFKYAQGYRAHHQYDRAELFYKNILKRFNHDKQAGLEYANMMAFDLAEYERAEEILKRDVLDYHVNDSDGILALGDTYLDWATEKDPSKYQDAFEQYSLLSQLYGGKNPDLYQSRFLRYNIRTDQLKNVLELKDFFYPREKSLCASDWTELSGYLFDKLYGDLPRDKEYLRGKIEDLRDMMLFAIKADPTNPVASYNLSRYLVQVGDHTKAFNALKTTEKLFDNTLNIKKRDVYKQIDTYRLLGEEYLYDREYILARETLTKGIDIFEKRGRQGSFEGDKNVGALYYDMGNIEYFISGDLESAHRNYKNSVANKHDTPSVRYRIGYIDYTNEDYASALNNFLKAAENGAADSHTLLALGNTLSLRNDNYVAQGYYNRLLNYLDFQREKYGIIIPQIDPSAGDMVEVYMKAANNLGVSQFRISRQSGDSALNAKALVNFQNSIRYYDALTRNQETLVRVPGSNLAVENMRYASNPISTYEPAIYTEIPRVLDGEKGLEQ